MTNDFSTYIYTTAQVRAGEQAAAAQLGLSLAQLMQRAAQAILQRIQQLQPAPARLLIICGPGNNGGDGWVLARLAERAGYQVRIAAATPRSELAQAAAEAWQSLGGRFISLSALQAEHIEDVDIVVDALLGSGLKRELEGDYLAAVKLINDPQLRTGRTIISVDVPTGLSSDTGQPLPIAVHAQHTIAMVALKAGLVTGQAANFVGNLSHAELGIQTAFFQQPFYAQSITAGLVATALPSRQPASHKGTHGHVLIIGGAPGMSGAVTLAGQAALRCGAGKVSIATHESSQLAIAVAQPELMVHTVTEDIQELLQQASVVVIGPGLGTSAWAQNLLRQALAWSGPLVVDADGLNLLSKLTVTRKAPWFLTPHPREAARLLQTTTTEINADRFGAARKISVNFQAHALLKGAGTLVAMPSAEPFWVCRRGTPALATGGTGDVLSGVVGAMVAQGVETKLVLPVAVWLHAVAGENAAKHGERGTIASDLLTELRRLVNPCQQ